MELVEQFRAKGIEVVVAPAKGMPITDSSR
jgi:hypothetical protein